MLAGCVLTARAGNGAEPGPAGGIDSPDLELLNAEEWRQLDRAVDHGLEFLSNAQRADGSFEAPEMGQPGITSLCVMAFLSRGHVPEHGPYGRQLDRAIDYVLDAQQENGLLFDQPLGHAYQKGAATHVGMYHHGIAGLMLSEVYGMTSGERRVRLDSAINAAIHFTRERQRQPKRNVVDRGGWRYLGTPGSLRSDSDLSVTTWQLMFLRSARNAEFEVPKESIDEALAYVRGAYVRSSGTFNYCQVPPGTRSGRAIVGSGILSLSLAGDHQSEMARAGGEWLLRHRFERYGEASFYDERFHYSGYYCSQAMFQLGGENWRQFFPDFQRLLVEHQLSDGSWPREQPQDGQFGQSYSTALAVLSLTPPYQLLPIYQR